VNEGASNGKVPLPSVTLSMTDLRSSETKTWSSANLQPAPAQFPDLLREAVKASARFCAVLDNDVQQSEMLSGLPNDDSWNSLLSSSKDDDEITYGAAIERDPDCRLLYSLAWSWENPHRYVDMALKKWPKDYRLLRDKVQRLRSADKPHAAFIYISELLRRYPDSLLLTHELPDVLNEALPETHEATEGPKFWAASIQHLRNQAARFPKNWYVQWDTALGLNNFGRFLRGGQTINKIPREILEQFSRTYDESVQYIDKAVELRPDCSDLLRADLYMNYTAGNVDVDWQTKMIERIHAIDPSNYKAEMLAAFSHSIGWGVEEDFWQFINMALKNHPNDPQAMYAIGHELGTELSRRMVNFKVWTGDQVYKESNPLTDKYIECTEFALDHGVQIDKWMAGMLREMYRNRYGEAKVQEIYESGKHWGLTGEAASHAYKAGDYERSLRLARMALAKAPSRDERAVQQQQIIRSLWKLKRYDESMSEAQQGISEFPEKSQFHYLYAVAASEKGGMDEEAFREVSRAIDYDQQVDAYNSLFERLRAKLNKPQHPKLVKQ
jgi:tetratricopeptide (TPR) repeat protein